MTYFPMCIAATAAAKMSERRNVRFLDEKLSSYPYFLVKNPGLNSGLMIPQYTQAGLLNDMKILSHPASVDSMTTSANQEDYVAMGYNACKKALECVKKLEYILAIELFSAYQAGGGKPESAGLPGWSDSCYGGGYLHSSSSGKTAAGNT